MSKVPRLIWSTAPWAEENGAWPWTQQADTSAEAIPAHPRSPPIASLGGSAVHCVWGFSFLYKSFNIECLLFTGMNLNADSQTRLSSPTLFLSISVIHWPYSTRPVHSLLSSRLPHFISLWWGGVFLGLDECKEHLRPIFSHLRFFVKRIVCALIHAQSLMIL